jgi:acyl-CoA thioester hydrolase
MKCSPHAAEVARTTTKAETATIITSRLDIVPRFHQTDMMGVIHNAEYLLWFEEGRLQIMTSILSIDEALKMGVVTPVVENHCVYKTPARFGDQLRLFTSHTVLTAYEGRLRFEHELVNNATKAQIAIGHTVVTLVDATKLQLIKEWSPDLWARYQQLGRKQDSDGTAGRTDGQD